MIMKRLFRTQARVNALTTAEVGHQRAKWHMELQAHTEFLSEPSPSSFLLDWFGEGAPRVDRPGIQVWSEALSEPRQFAP